MADEKTIPLDPAALESAAGVEFYLIVAGETTRATLAALRDREMTPSERARHGIKAARDRILRRRRHITADYIGSLIEIRSRAPARLEGYLWGNPERIALADGSGLGARVHRAYDEFIFVPEHIRSLGRGMAMRGVARPYSLSDDWLGMPLPQQVHLDFKTKPASKAGCSIARLDYMAP